MRTIYEVHTYPDREDFDDEALARTKVEAHGSGYVVTFHRGFDGKDRSGAMNVYREGKWDGVDISR